MGGRFSPGIDLTFIVRDPYLYRQDWTDPKVGPFRIGAKPLDYSQAKPDKPFLGVGYKPGHNNPATGDMTDPKDILQVEPGDLCKFMALPWHTDYNSCATHEPAPNPARNTTLFWSWPAQRPVSVYTYDDYVKQGNNLFVAVQQFSVRGSGTVVTADSTNEGSAATENAGRFQNRLDIIRKWFDIGVVIQGPAIETFEGEDGDIFLEVESRLKGPSDWSQPWPILTTDRVYPSTDG